jgi:hypothetical protein
MSPAPSPRFRLFIPGRPNTAARRALGEWSARGDFPFAARVLQAYRLVVATGIFKG